MSLVAYGSSDESDNSDIEETPTESVQNGQITSANGNASKVSDTDSRVDTKSTASVQPDKVKNATTAVQEDTPKSLTQTDPKVEAEDDIHISDEEDDYVGPSSFGLNLPPPKQQAASSSAALNQTDKTPTPSSSLLAGLPQPKAPIDLKAEEDELEDFVKKKEVPVEKPPPKKAKVKITIPSLADIGSDEDDEPAKKRPKPEGGKTGLLSLLSAPKNAVTKEANRALIPHTLTKKPAKPPPKKVMPKRPIKQISATKVLPGVPDDDSDDEEMDTANFFSLGGNAPSTIASAPNPLGLKDSVSVQPSDGPSENLGLGTSSEPSKMESSVDDDIKEEDSAPGVSDAPLDFKPMAGPSYPSKPKVASSQGSWDGEWGTNQQYNMAYQDDNEQGPEVTVPGPAADLSAEDQMLRLQGRKAFRNEEINIIDVHQDDQMSKDELMKSISEEQSQMSSFSKKNPNLPSSQQKRKHQITYLAFKAKEREIDLKNQWAQNKATKRAAANKYGF